MSDEHGGQKVELESGSGATAAVPEISTSEDELSKSKDSSSSAESSSSSPPAVQFIAEDLDALQAYIQHSADAMDNAGLSPLDSSKLPLVWDLSGSPSFNALSISDFMASPNQVFDIEFGEDPSIVVAGTPGQERASGADASSAGDQPTESAAKTKVASEPEEATTADDSTSLPAHAADGGKDTLQGAVLQTPPPKKPQDPMLRQRTPLGDSPYTALQRAEKVYEEIQKHERATSGSPLESGSGALTQADFDAMEMWTSLNLLLAEHGLSDLQVMQPVVAGTPTLQHVPQSAIAPRQALLARGGEQVVAIVSHLLKEIRKRDKQIATWRQTAADKAIGAQEADRNATNAQNLQHELRLTEQLLRSKSQEVLVLEAEVKRITKDRQVAERLARLEFDRKFRKQKQQLEFMERRLAAKEQQVERLQKRLNESVVSRKLKPEPTKSPFKRPASRSPQKQRSFSPSLAETVDSPKLRKLKARVAAAAAKAAARKDEKKSRIAAAAAAAASAAQLVTAATENTHNSSIGSQSSSADMDDSQFNFEEQHLSTFSLNTPGGEKDVPTDRSPSNSHEQERRIQDLSEQVAALRQHLDDVLSQPQLRADFGNRETSEAISDELSRTPSQSEGSVVSQSSQATSDDSTIERYETALQGLVERNKSISLEVSQRREEAAKLANEKDALTARVRQLEAEVSRLSNELSDGRPTRAELAEAKRRIEVFQRQARLHSIKKAAQSDRNAVRRQIRRDRRRANGQDSESSDPEEAVEQELKQALCRVHEVEDKLDKVRKLLNVQRGDDVERALATVLGAFESLLKVRGFLDRVCRLVVPDHPTNLDLLLSTLSAWKESFFSEATLTAQKRRLVEELRQQDEAVDHLKSKGDVNATPDNVKAEGGPIPSDIDTSNAISFRDAFRKAFTDGSSDDHDKLLSRLGEIYSFVGQTTQFLEALSNQILPSPPHSEDESTSGDGQHDTKPWSVEILNRCLEKVYNLASERREMIENLDDSAL